MQEDEPLRLLALGDNLLYKRTSKQLHTQLEKCRDRQFMCSTGFGAVDALTKLQQQETVLVAQLQNLDHWFEHREEYLPDGWTTGASSP